MNAFAYYDDRLSNPLLVRRPLGTPLFGRVPALCFRFDRSCFHIPYPGATAIRQRALESLGRGVSLVRRILRVRFARLGAICLSVEARLYAHSASTKCWKAPAGVLLLSQNLEFVRVLDTLKHTSRNWTGAHVIAKPVLAIFFSCLAISTTDVGYLRSLYILCAMHLGKLICNSSRFRVSNMHSSTALILSAILTAPFLQPFVNGQQLYGSIMHIGEEGNGLVVITVENNSTSNFSIEARNNLFDTDNPWQPMNVTNFAGTAVALVGAEYSYGRLDDASFISMPSGAVWRRELNMTAYMPPDTTITKPTAKCYYVSFPNGFWAINTSNMPEGEELATQFLTPGANRLVDLPVVSNILHLNISAVPATPTTPIPSTQAIPEEPAPTAMSGTKTYGLATIQTYGTSIEEYGDVIGG